MKPARVTTRSPHCNGGNIDFVNRGLKFGKGKTLIDREKPATGYECADCHSETLKLPAALTRLRFHDLRHSAVSRMIAARVPIPMIAKIVGWSASTMTKMAACYGHFGIEELRSAVESISIAQPEIAAHYPQNPPQSTIDAKTNIN